MNAEEVEHEEWSQNEGIRCRRQEGLMPTCNEIAHGLRCGDRRDRAETKSLGSVCETLNDLVVGRFPLSAVTRQVSENGLMKFEYQVCRYRHCRRRVVDERQRITVTCNFLFRSVSRFGPMEYDLLQLKTRG